MDERAARARQVAQLYGLPAEDLVMVPNAFTNDVWAVGDRVIRISRAPGFALARERRVIATARRAAPSLPLPSVLHYGRNTAMEWLVERRLPGCPLMAAWSTLEERRRCETVASLARQLRDLHRRTARPSRGAFPRRVLQGLRRRVRDLAEMPGVAPWLAGVVMARAEEWIGAFGDEEPLVLVHNDLQFNNVLVDETGIGGIVDWGRARWGPPDLELDILLRFVRYPWLFAAEGAEEAVRRQDFGRVPAWMGVGYPELFAHARLTDRLRLYALSYDLRQLLRHPHLVGRPALDQPWGRLWETLGMGRV